LCIQKKLLQNPGVSFIKAAKLGATDELQGSLEALAWGKIPRLGTGAHFEFLYSGKVDPTTLQIECILPLPNK